MNKEKLKKEEFEIGSWDDIKNEYFEVMLTESLVKQLGLNLVSHDGNWWVQVNKEKLKEKKHE
jgi:hypothetical protein